MLSAREALERLRTGNERFLAAAGEQQGSERPRTAPVDLAAVAQGQTPFAVILGCSDSRAAPEIVFNQGLGDLFVIRVAGGIVTPEVVGSVEFAVHQLGVRLVVVLGHSSCGAVAAAVEQERSGERPESPALAAVTTPIVEALGDVTLWNPSLDAEAREAVAVRRNVRASARRLLHASASLREMATDDGPLVVAQAVYDLPSGRVDFPDEAALARAT